MVETMDILCQWLYNNLDIIFFVYGFAFVAMGIAILVQPRRGSGFRLADILWLLALFGITHGINEFLDMWAIIKGRHPSLDLVRWFILVISYFFLFEFGRRLFRLTRPESPLYQKKVASLLVWRLSPVIGVFIFLAGFMSADFWKTGSIWTRYLLGLPGGLLIGFGFRAYYKGREDILEQLNLRRYFLLGGIPFIIYGILGGLIVPKGDFFPSNILNTESFLAVVKMPVQTFRAICAITAAWAVAGIIQVFNWEARRKLEESHEKLEHQLEENQRLVRNLELLHEISRDIMAEFEIETLLKKIADNARQLIGCRYAVMAVLNKEGGYEYFIPSGIEPSLYEELKKKHGLPSGKGLLGYLLREGKPIRVDDISRHPASVGLPEGHHSIKTLLAVPIILHEEVIGRIYFSERLDGKKFSQKNEALAESFASTVALAVNKTFMLRDIEHLATFPEKSPHPILECDMDCNVVFYNPAAQKVMNELGIEVKKFLPSDICEIVGGLEAFDKETGYHEIRLDNYIFGEYIHLLPDRKSFRIYAFDITESKKIAKAWYESEERYRVIIENINEIIYRVAIDGDPLGGKVNYVSSQVENILGYNPDEFYQNPGLWLEIVHPDDKSLLMESTQKIFASKRTGTREYRLRHKEKAEYCWVEDKVVPFIDEYGRIVAIQGVARDITERKEAEESLRQSEQRFQLAAQSVSDLIYEWDILSNRLDWWGNIDGILGYAPGEFPRTLEAWEKIIHPDDHDRVMASVERHLKTRQPWYEEYRVLRKDGTICYWTDQGTALWDEKGNAYKWIGANTDITRHKRAEEKIEKDYQIQRVLNSLLHVSLEDVPLTEQLVRCLDIILSAPFLTLLPKGGIFLVEDEPDVLVLKANRALPVPLQGICAKVPFGRCLCSRAAKSREIQFADCLDDRHDNRYDGLTPHGHYNVPILSRDKVLGVLVLYLQEHHHQKKEEIDFLQAVADTLAGLIERKKAEEEILNYTKELLALADSSNAISTTTTTYENICDIAVRNFGLKMAWLGLIDEENVIPAEAGIQEVKELDSRLHGNDGLKAFSGKIVKPVAQAGFEQGYLSSIKVTWDDSPTGMGPSGMAIKTKMPRVTHAMDADPAYAPWREEAMKRGYCSSLAVPLIDSGGKVIGVLNLYSDKPQFFTKDRIRIFTVFANHAAAAIENRMLIEGLESKVKDRTKEVEVARLQAESASRAKSDFLANMSHELRTPLNSIIGFSDLMINEQAGATSEMQREYLNDIINSGRHLLSLINDILDLSKIEAGMMGLELNEFNVRETIEASLMMFKEKAMKHGIETVVEIGDDVGDITADSRKFKQVMLNLLGNAFKFTPDGGRVRVCARLVRRDEGEKLRS